MITTLGLKTTGSPPKKTIYAITSVSIKGFSDIITEFEKLSYNGYVQKSPKHEPTYSYFYLPRHLSKCSMITDAFNLHIDSVKTETIGTQHITILHVCYLDKSESKGIIVNKKLSHVCSTDKIESESVIVHESSIEDSRSESVHKSINTSKEKYSIDETDDEEPSVTYNPVINEPSYFNIF